MPVSGSIAFAKPAQQTVLSPYIHESPVMASRDASASHLQPRLAIGVVHMHVMGPSRNENPRLGCRTPRELKVHYQTPAVPACVKTARCANLKANRKSWIRRRLFRYRLKILPTRPLNRKKS
jgi:hypothetical protein